MTPQPPTSDSRRASALRSMLLDIAPSVAPEWFGPERQDTFGRALIEIASRMGEETTRRLDQTARRDLAAFLDALDIAPAPPQAAEAIVVFTLGENRESPVFAPRRVRLAADVANADVMFETDSALSLTPSKLVELIAVDPVADRIERSPDVVTSVTPPEESIESYELVGFVDRGSDIIQLNPSVGIEETDLLRIGDAAYRVDKLEDGLIRLTDPLEEPADEGSAVRKISAFETYDQRDLQEHSFFVGHESLFNLEQPAQISLCFTPASVSQRLASLNVSYSLWGTLEGETEPGWQELNQLSASAGVITLVKDWVGTVDKSDVDSQTNRWLRVSLVDPLAGPAPISISASQLQIRVKSETDSVEAAAPAPQASGTDTIAAAFTNRSPLAVSGRFLPFGADPVRSDVFAFAAPEAFSKRGAEVAVDVTVVDASITVVDVSDSQTSGTRAYGVGPNGSLQTLPYRDGETLPWVTVDPPDETIEFDNFAIHGTTIEKSDGATSDLVVVADRRGQWWSARIDIDATGAPSDEPVWHQIATFADGNGLDRRGAGREMSFEAIALVPVAASGQAVLVTAGTDAIYALMLDAQGDDPEARWQQVTFDQLSGSLPALAEPARFAPIGGTPPNEFAEANLILADAQGKLWQIMIDPVRLTGNLYLLDDERLSASDVLPAASFFETDQGTALWASWATADDRTIVGVQKLGMGDITSVEFPSGNLGGSQFVMPPASRLLVGSRTRPVNGERPAIAAIGLDDSGRNVAMVWEQNSPPTFTPLPEKVATGPAPTSSFLLSNPSDGSPLVAFAGPAESLYVRSPAAGVRDVEVTLQSSITYTGSESPDYLVFEPNPDDETTEAIQLRTRIEIDETRVFDLPSAEAQRGRQYLLLRSIDGGYQATLQRVTNRDKVRLDLDDSTTSQGDYMLIGGLTYRIDAIEAGVATLDRGLRPDSGDLVNYSILRTIPDGPGRVGRDDVDTLVRVANGAQGITAGSSLVFENGTPSTQQIQLSSVQDGVAWAKLSSPWLLRPSTVNGQSQVTVVAGSEDDGDWTTPPSETTPRNPDLVWEFYDGDGWRLLENLEDSTGNFITSGTINFRVPETIQTVNIGGRTDYWVRATLIGGDYGQANQVTTIEPVEGVEGATKETVTFDRSGLKPPEIAAIEARFEQGELESSESLLVRNNLETIDQTQAASALSARFELFSNAASIDGSNVGRALYLGFDRPIGVNPLNLFVDVDDQPGDGGLIAEVLTPLGWRGASLLDGTKGMRRRNTVGVFLNDEVVRTQLFGNEGHWVRLRPDTSSRQGNKPGLASSWNPVIRGLFPNAAAVSQARTVEQEIVGTSLGEPSLRLALSETPVLPDSLELRIREQLSDEEVEGLREEQAAFGSAQPGVRPEVPPITARLDDVAGTWVLWRRVESFVGSDGDARVYQLDPGSGTITFGDGVSGKMPPAGRDAIRAFEYQSGGGSGGNIPAWTELSLRSTLEGVDEIAAPAGAAGGADAPTGDQTYAGAPDRLRHSGQALSPVDFEALAIASSTDIVNACCFFPAALHEPIRLVIAQRTSQRCPQPTVEAIDVLRDRLCAVGWGGLNDESLEVNGPRYVEVQVQVKLRARASQVSQVEESTTNALVDFLDPIDGGPDGSGWPFGRGLWTSDILRLVESIDDVDVVESVEIEVRPESKGCAEIGPDSIPTDALICALPEHIDVSVEPIEVKS